MAFQGGVRPRDTESDNVGLLVGEPAGQQITNRRYNTRRQDGYRGEHPLACWSRPPMPESPEKGYAPLASQTKRWANESPIEGWFPQESGERHVCNVIRVICGRHRRDSQRRENQPVRSMKTDAGCQTRSTQRAGEVCLDSLPHRRQASPAPEWIQFHFMKKAAPEGRPYVGEEFSSRISTIWQVAVVYRPSISFRFHRTIFGHGCSRGGSQK